MPLLAHAPPSPGPPPHEPSHKRAPRAQLTPRAQLSIERGGHELAPLLARLARQFPRLATLALVPPPSDDSSDPRAIAEFEQALAALPAGCWPAVAAAGPSWGPPPRAAAQLPRLCPNPRDVCVGANAAADLAHDLRAVSAAPGLEAVALPFRPALCADAEGSPEAAAALAALTGLRRLSVRLGGAGRAGRGAAAELLAAVAPLSRLTALVVSSVDEGLAPPPLRGCPASLVELTLGDAHACWDARALEGALPVPGVTKLRLLG